MKRAELDEIARSVNEVTRASTFASRLQKVEVEAEDDGDTGPFLRVILYIDNSNDLRWQEVEPLVRSIEDSIARIDERYPSVRFPEAA